MPHFSSIKAENLRYCTSVTSLFCDPLREDGRVGTTSGLREVDLTAVVFELNPATRGKVVLLSGAEAELLLRGDVAGVLAVPIGLIRGGVVDVVLAAELKA